MRPRQRTDTEVLTRARQADAAREAGLTGEQLVELVAARADWHAAGRLALLTATLAEAVESPAAMAWDGVFTAAVRRELRNLSAPPSTVTP